LDFVKQWVENMLFSLTDIGTFNIMQSDPDFQNVVNSLSSDSSSFDFTAAFATLRTQLSNQGWTRDQIADVVRQQQQQIAGLTWAEVLTILSSRVGAAAEQGQRITFSAGISATKRRLTLLHELVHFYAHPDYRAWVATTTGERFFNEGFTEFLARQVMTPDELQNRDEYQDRFDAISQEVAAYVSVDDITNAFFQGEVWRIETQSAVAQRLFGTQVGLEPGGSRATERRQSRVSQGIVQTITPGQYYRFMNLGVNESRPKPEHEAALRQIITTYILTNPNARLRFVGHASSPGSTSHNMTLGRNRARAFYNLARQLGVAQNQLVDANNPATAGESTPNVTENDRVIHRALNRRVELFIE
jgi:outer membrane protein OmpA-like peptidoglycan-associated protein